MREIKFRAWVLGKMWEVRSLTWTEDGITIHTGGGFMLLCEEDDVALMQYTGLKDKSGKEIYEGDIFKITQKPEEINLVIFYFGCWQFEEHGLHLNDWYDKGEVIGNIYENPELLKS